MNIVDSCGWIEYAKDSPLADTFEPVLRDTDNLVVPSITLFEVYKKLSLECNELKARLFVNRMNQSHVITLDSGLAISAAQYSREYKLPMADSIIYAPAVNYECVLWTSDSHFKDLPQVKYFDKTAS
jgi:PIN domain nuclease of toxin-antitoxin system